MRLSDPKPAYCSSCFGQSQGNYVDFEAAWDGPVVDPGNGIKQCIDDLHLCETCLTAGAALIGLTDNAALAKQVADLESQLERATADRARLEDQAKHLRAAVDVGGAKRVFQKAA